MGTKVEFKSCLTGYSYSTKDMNQDSSSTGWPLFYTEKSIHNVQYQNGPIPRSLNEIYDKNLLKQKMLEHEAIFKNQVYELHRVYRVQKEMMEELQKKELNKHHILTETSSSTSFLHLPNNGCSSSKPYNATHPGLVSSQNGWSSKDCEILESRPSKVRKKQFDLELPADEYIDSEEELERGEMKENKRSDTTSKRDSIGFADLNAPFRSESTSTGPKSVDFLGVSCRDGETRGHDNETRLKLPYRWLPGELSPNFPPGTSNHCTEDKKSNGRGWMLNNTESGTSKSNLTFMPQSCQSENKLPIPSHPSGPNGFMYNKVPQQHPSSVIRMSDQNQSKYNYQETVMATRIPASYPFHNSHSVSSWGNPLNLVQTNPSVCWSRNPQLSDLTHVDRWHVNGSSTSNQVFNSEPPTSNKFYHGFPSRSNELSGYYPSRGFDFPNAHKVTNFFMDSKSARDMNPNLMMKFSSNEAVHSKNIEIVDLKEKSRDWVGSLPWLRAKPAGKIEGSGTRNDPISVDLPSSSNSHKNETINNSLSFISPSKGKYLIVESKHRLIDINVACDASSLEENITNGESTINLGNRFDLNSCVSDDEDATEPCESKQDSNRRIGLDIDLEAPIVQESEESTIAEVEQNWIEQLEADFIKTAADSIVTMSTLNQHHHTDLETSVGEPLAWFVDLVTSCEVELDKGKTACIEIDYYEAMTLQLKETKEEEYVAEPFVLETQDDEKENRSGRTRRNQSRRGRQRRDFQRDILPGLTSLSRHEVTEDFQTFSGLMRATGYTNWQRRTGGGAGRRRRRQVVAPPPPPPLPPPEQPVVCKTLMERLQGIEVGLEDKSLTGWGKTTRRPRRQRCPAAGNSTAVAIALT